MSPLQSTNDLPGGNISQGVLHHSCSDCFRNFGPTHNDTIFDRSGHGSHSLSIVVLSFWCFAVGIQRSTAVMLTGLSDKTIDRIYRKARIVVALDALRRF